MTSESNLSNFIVRELVELKKEFPVEFQYQVMKQIKNSVEVQDTTLFLCMPGVGKRRIANFFARNKQVGRKYFSEYRRVYYHCENLPLSFKSQIIFHLVMSMLTHMPTIIILDSVDRIYDKKEIMDFIQSYHSQFHNHLTFISFSGYIEPFVVHSHSVFLSQYEFISQNIQYIPGMKGRDQRILLEALNKKYGLKLSDTIFNKIMILSGGNISIGIILVRMIKSGGITEIDLDNSELLLERIPPLRFLMYEMLSKLGKDLEKKLCSGVYHDDIHLRKLGIVVDSGELFSDIFEVFLRKYGSSNSGGNTVKELKAVLSLKEYLLFNTLLLNKGDVVSREDIAKVLWGTEHIEKYSDYAIEKTIQIIRKKLLEYSYNYEIKVKRGVGYYILNK